MPAAVLKISCAVKVWPPSLLTARTTSWLSTPLACMNVVYTNWPGLPGIAMTVGSPPYPVATPPLASVNVVQPNVVASCGVHVPPQLFAHPAFVFGAEPLAQETRLPPV